MLPLHVVQEIQRLLEADQISQRKIAKKLGVSRGSVNAIATGKRGAFGREPKVDEPPPKPPERCPACGGLVVMPCVYCKANTYRQRLREQRRRRRKAADEACLPLGAGRPVNPATGTPAANGRDQDRPEAAA